MDADRKRRLYEERTVWAIEGSWSQLYTDEPTYLWDRVQDPDAPGGHVLEVGTNRGGTTRMLCRALREAQEAGTRPAWERVWTCDPYPEEGAWSATALLRATNALAVCQQEGATFLLGGAQEYAVLCGATRPFRMAFVDGEHTHEGVRYDVEALLCGLLMPGGWAVLHDAKGDRAVPGIAEYASKPDGCWDVAPAAPDSLVAWRLRQ